MYAQKYDEEFSSHLPGFVTTVWNLLITTGSHVKYDQVNFSHSTALMLLIYTRGVATGWYVGTLCLKKNGARILCLITLANVDRF